MDAWQTNTKKTQNKPHQIKGTKQKITNQNKTKQEKHTTLVNTKQLMFIACSALNLATQNFLS